MSNNFEKFVCFADVISQSINHYLFYLAKIRQLSLEYKYNFFVRLLLEVYLEVWVLSLLNLRYYKFETAFQGFSFAFSFAMITIWGWAIIWISLFLKKNHKKLKEGGLEEIAAEFIILFEDYKQKLVGLIFNVIFFCRRILYAIAIIFLIDYPEVQSVAFLILMAFVAIYHIVAKPYKSTSINAFSIFNEWMLCALGAVNFTFIEPIADKDKNLTIGWILIGIVMCKWKLLQFFTLKFRFKNIA